MPPSLLPSVILSTSAPGTNLVFAAQWLAYALACRRFADTLTDARARLGADVVRYSFIVVDLHHLLFAGFDRRTKIQEKHTKRWVFEREAGRSTPLLSVSERPWRAFQNAERF
jgi:hypothetical protein